MRKALPRVLCLFLCISLFLDTSGQVESEKTKKLAVLKKDTAYKRFQSQLTAIMKTAKGRKTNYAAVRSLFEKNKTMLEGLKKRYNITTTPIAMSNTDKISLSDRPLARLANTSSMEVNIYEYSKTGPFNGFYTNGIGVMDWDTSTTGNKIYFTATKKNDEYESNQKMGSNTFGFIFNIPVPNNPQIVAVRLVVEYSFFCTGWDTESADLATSLCFHFDDHFNSPTYNSLPTNRIIIGYEGADRFPVFSKNVIQLFDRNFTDLEDYVYSKEAAFSIEGYVTPGQTFYMRLAAGYTPESKIGSWDSYHYGEFGVKKLSVKFLKAGE